MEVLFIFKLELTRLYLEVFNLVDKIHEITFVFILVTTLFSLISLKLYDRGIELR